MTAVTPAMAPNAQALAASSAASSDPGSAQNTGDRHVINVSQLLKRFGQRIAVNRIDLQVARGEIYGFLGPNGSGKTTTLRMLCGLLTPDAGSGHCLGFDIRSQASEIKKRIGYMTQKFSLYEDLSVEENLRFVAQVYQMPTATIAIENTLIEMQLSERRTQLAGALSGGWKQRLALAACQLHAPELLLLDEPTAGVDPGARRQFWEHLHTLAARGVTVLVSTHYMDEAERCHRLAYINNGQLLATGSPEQLVEQFGLPTWALTSTPNPAIHTETSSAPDAALTPGFGPALLAGLRALPGVALVTPFGHTLHVCGDDHTLEASLQSFASQHRLQVQALPASLEDVFIRLQQQADAGALPDVSTIKTATPAALATTATRS